MRCKYIVLLILLFEIHISCIEKYNPSINHVTDAIVVQGLVTNLKETYTVSIALATPFDSSLNYVPVQAKSVTIRDNLGNVYPLLWNLQYYYTDSNQFTAVPGRYYILQIEMSNGDIYESSTQKLLSPATIDSVYGYYDTRGYYYLNPLNQIMNITIPGYDNYMDLSYPSDSITQFRFDNTLMVCYSYFYWYTESMKEAGEYFPLPLFPGCFEPVCGYQVFGWQKFNLNSSINLSPATQTMFSTQLNTVSVCFFPDPNQMTSPENPFLITYNYDSCITVKSNDTICGPVKVPLDSGGQILSTKIYTLNKASSLYYQEINAQLSSQGKLFNPIEVQLQGNLKCINNSSKLVFGLFEASACVVKTYIVTFNPVTKRVNFIPAKDISTIPPNGISQTKPAFWP